MKTLSIALSLATLLTTAEAENWMQWRGPSFNGSTTERGLPTEFSKTKSVKWVAELPGPSAATPIIWEDKVFVSSGDDKAKSLRAMCVERTTGKVLWNNPVGVGYNNDEKSNFSSPSPVTDGRVVVFLYGNGQLAAFDTSGKSLWSRDLQKDYGAFAY